MHGRTFPTADGIGLKHEYGAAHDLICVGRAPNWRGDVAKRYCSCYFI